MLKRKHQDIVLNSITEGVCTVDRNWRITSFNRAASRITGVPADKAVGQFCCDVIKASVCEKGCLLRRTIGSGSPIVAKHVYILDSEGCRVPISMSTALLEDKAGNIIGGVETFRDMSLVEELRKELEKKYSFADIIGRSPAMRHLFDIVPDLARSDSTILIEGASGTGKELFARAIHDLSPRQKQRFVAINCGALPDTLLESELFGHKAGAFTDARKDKPGKFAQAHGGTIFLDEIGDISPAMQSRLLRVLQNRVIEPLGSLTSFKVDIRVIAATNKHLEELVETKVFREDLYYRVKVFALSLPLLRERRDDIPILVEHFISKFNRRRSKPIKGVSEEAMTALMAHNYPGNVRELENIIEHAFILCHGWFIEPKHLPLSLRPADTVKMSPGKPPKSLKEWEALLIVDAVRRHEGNRAAAARELAIDSSTLFRKVKSLGIKLPKPRGGD